MEFRVDMDRIYNFNAEASVIGSILMDCDSICEVIDILDSKDFYNLKHKIIYKKLKEMHEGKPSCRYCYPCRKTW